MNMNSEFFEELAQMVAESDDPAAEFEYMYAGRWTQPNKIGQLVSMVEIGCPWRRRDRMMVIEGEVVPRPLRSEPASGAQLYRVALRDLDLTAPVQWPADPERMRWNTWLRRGLLHANRADAESHARALIKASGGRP